MADTTENTPTAQPAPAAPVVEVSRTAPALPEGKLFIWGVGRRKKATARIRIRPGSGKFTVNEREVENFFTEDKDRAAVYAPLNVAKMLKSWDVFANVNGGGATGQAGAICLGLSRALLEAVPELDSSFRDASLLTRDARMKERKKYGQKGARKRFQFSKR